MSIQTDEQSPLRAVKGHCEPLTLSDYCSRWLTYSRIQLKESSYVKYENQINKYIIPELGHNTFATLTPWELERFLLLLQVQCGLSPKTAKDIMVLLNSIIRYAGKTDSGYKVIQIDYPKVPKQEMRILTRAEQQTFISYLLHNMDSCKFGVLLALLTGIRIGELCALKWSDLSVDEEIIRISATMQRIKNTEANELGKTQITITSPKSEKSIRSIPMSPMIANICKHMTPEDGQAYLLTGTRRYMEPRTLQYRLKKYTTDCGLEGVHFHTLRHTFATRCMEVGFDVKVLSEVLGHANTSITLDRYVHVSFDIKRENMRKLSAVGM